MIYALILMLTGIIALISIIIIYDKFDKNSIKHHKN